MTKATLVHPLVEGPVDVVGDVHGETHALADLMRRLGYSEAGAHPEGRRLVFVGDLVDRGPDSPVVVERVRDLVHAGRAQCVLGNHDLNLLIANHKPDNVWFFHHLPAGDRALDRRQTWADRQTRAEILRFFRELPLALERADLRVIHACWDDAMIERARQAESTDAYYEAERARLEEEVRRRGLEDRIERKLVHQNENPVKLLTSGPEEKAELFESNGEVRSERRVAWWLRYEGPLCVFGHYWRTLLSSETDHDHFFDVPKAALLGRCNAMCVDYSVGRRFRERRAPGFDGRYQTQLAALRLPERVLIFDDGEQLPLISAGS
jgi:hypothetical protein